MADGGEPIKVIAGIVEWAFTVVDKGVYYVGNDSGEYRMAFFNFGIGKSTIVARNLGMFGGD